MSPEYAKFKNFTTLPDTPKFRPKLVKLFMGIGSSMDHHQSIIIFGGPRNHVPRFIQNVTSIMEISFLNR